MLIMHGVMLSGQAVAAAKANVAMLDQLVAESLRDIPSDEELSDTEDPELLVCVLD